MKCVAIIGLIGLITTSCEDQVPVDIRDPALGAYSYQMKVYEMTATGLLHMSDADLGGHFEVVKGSDEYAIDAKEGAFVAFSGVNAQKGPEGFTFDVKDQTGMAGDSEILLKGYDGISHAGGVCQGLYSSREQTITVNFIFTLRRSDFLVEVTGVRP